MRARGPPLALAQALLLALLVCHTLAHPTWRYGGILLPAVPVAANSSSIQRQVLIAMNAIQFASAYDDSGRALVCGVRRLVRVASASEQLLAYTENGVSQAVMQLMTRDYRPFSWRVQFGKTYRLSLVVEHGRGDEHVHHLVLTTDAYMRLYTVTSHTHRCVRNCRPPAAPPAGRPLRIACYNIWNTNGDWEARLRAMQRLFADALQLPDIIAFQEVRIDRSRPLLAPASAFAQVPLDVYNQVAQLAAILPGYQYVWQPAMSYPQLPLGRVEEGVAVFTRHTIAAVDYRLLSRDRYDETDVHQRILLHARVRLHDRAASVVDMFVTHMALSIAARVRNAREIAQFIDARASAAGMRVLTGDFNECLADRRTGFGRVIEYLTAEHGLTDAWTEHWTQVALRRALASSPRPAHDGNTFPAGNETLRIDLLLYRSHAFRPLRADVFGDAAVSDHLGVAVDFGPALG